MDTWQFEDAKARLSDLVRRAQEAPQSITVHGKPVAVVVSRAAFDGLSLAPVSLVDFMRASPLAKLGAADAPVFDRMRGGSRTALAL